MKPTPCSLLRFRKRIVAPFRRPIPDPIRLLVPSVLALLAGPVGSAAEPFERLPDLPSNATSTWFTSWGDYDNDGDIDLIVANGGDSKAQTMDLYRNRGNGTFDRMTGAEVGPLVTELGSWVNAAWTDFDHDGYLDVLAAAQTYQGGTGRPPCIFRNLGNGRFHLVAAGDASHVGIAENAFTSVPGDLNGDGLVDFLALTAGTTTPHALFFNRGDGGFTRDRTSAIAQDRLAANGDSVADFDNDGDLDLFGANVASGAAQPDRLYVNDGRGRFTVVTNLPFLNTAGWTAHASWGDVDNDGDFDILLHKEAGPRFFRNDNGAFVAADIGPTGGLGTGLWVDYDNDGHLDLYIERAQSVPGRCSLLRNRGDGTLEPVTNLLTTVAARRQCSNWGDFDNDGFMDLIDASPTGGTRLHRNLGNANHWLKLTLKGTASDHFGLGAVVHVRATLGGKPVEQMQQVGGNMPTSLHDLRPNFGLGDATKADEVRIRWPSGNVQVLNDVAANQILTVIEPSPFRPIQPVATIHGTLTITNTTVASAHQWYFEGTELAGATQRVLTLQDLSTARAGRYSVVAQTAGGPQTNHVQVRVLEQFTRILEGDLVTDRDGSISATWFDPDGDGDLDLFVGNSTSRSPQDAVDRFYLNRGDGTFTSATNSPLVATAVSSAGCSPGDIDNDGDLDLYVPVDETLADQLFRNDGQGGFSLIVGQPFGEPGAWNLWSAWADYDLDGDIDLFGGRGFIGDPLDDTLYKNDGTGRFTAVTAEETGDLLRDHRSNWGGLWYDYDGDGAQDLLVCYQLEGTRLYRNNRNGTFTKMPTSVFSSPTGDGAVGAADYDNDGLLDVLITAADAGRSALHRNLGNGTFLDVTSPTGIVFPPREDWPSGFWADYDNDGHIDLLIVSYPNCYLYRNRGDGSFQKVPVGNLQTDGQRKTMGAWGDYDNDGFPDLYVVCGDAQEAPNFLYRNHTNGNHWLKVKPVGTVSNRDGMGAKVRLTARIGERTFTQMREISGIGLVAHFGLGNASRATKVRIEWPSGIVQELTGVSADQVLTVTEPAAIRLTATRVAEGIRIEWRGEPQVAYTLGSTSSLTAWLEQTVTADATGLAVITIPTNGSAVFYRVWKR